jgi:hypothetical protein
VITLLNAIEQKLNVILNVSEQILNATVITLLNAIKQILNVAEQILNATVMFMLFFFNRSR